MAATHPPPPVSAQPQARPASDSWVLRLFSLMRTEPALGVTLAYVLVSFVGVWCNYWFYRWFGLPILSYMQAGDFLVAGLRDPAYLIWMAVSGIFAYAFAWPTFHWRRDPDAVARWQRHWWGRIVFNGRMDPALPRKKWAWTPETALAFGLFWGGIWLLMGYVTTKAQAIREGAGDRVRVTMAGSSTPLVGEARLLGTTGGYVLLFWPDNKRAEALSVDAVGRIESLGRRGRPSRAVLPSGPRTAPVTTP